jgi:hypothetical protein
MEKISRAFAAPRVRVMLVILRRERLRRKALKKRDNQKFKLARRLRFRYMARSKTRRPTLRRAGLLRLETMTEIKDRLTTEKTDNLFTF